MNPTIEQAVKALERISKMYVNTWDLVDGGLMMFQERIPEFEAAHDDVQKAATSLRSLTEPMAVSKTDEELARELAKKVVSLYKVTPYTDKYKSMIDAFHTAFTAIRAQAMSEAIELAATECDRHAKFCKDEAHKGGDFVHLMTLFDEATYNAQQIRKLKDSK